MLTQNTYNYKYDFIITICKWMYSYWMNRMLDILYNICYHCYFKMQGILFADKI